MMSMMLQYKVKKKHYNPCYGDGFKFQVKLGDQARIEKVEKLIPTMRVKLHEPNLQCLSENGVLYLTTCTSAFKNMDNNLRLIFASEEYRSAFKKMNIVHPVGFDSNRDVMICDLKEYPHALVSGTTGSGKSTALKCLLTSMLLYKPVKINLLIADRVATFSDFKDFPHLSCPVINEPEKLAFVFMLLQEEWDRRTKLQREDKQAHSKLPYIICIIDEFSWFIKKMEKSNINDDIADIITDILRYGRQHKIHCGLSIHDPKKDIAIIE